MTQEELEQENLMLRAQLASAKQEVLQAQRQALIAVMTASQLQLRVIDEQMGKVA